jgi:hypothetical protein
MLVTFPPVFMIDAQILRNPLRLLAERSQAIEGALANFVHNRTRGFLFQPADGRDPVLIVTTGRHFPDGYPRVIQAAVDPAHRAADLSAASWVRHPALGREVDVRAVQNWNHQRPAPRPRSLSAEVDRRQRQYPALTFIVGTNAKPLRTSRSTSSSRDASPLRQRYQRRLPLLHEEPRRLALHLKNLIRECKCLDLVERGYRVVVAGNRL